MHFQRILDERFQRDSREGSSHHFQQDFWDGRLQEYWESGRRCSELATQRNTKATKLKSTNMVHFQRRSFGGMGASIQNSAFYFQKPAHEVDFNASKPDVIVGYGQMGQVLANLLSALLASGLDGDSVGCPYVAFDLDPYVVKASRKLGFPVLYGDGSQPSVLRSAGISSPKSAMFMYSGKEETIEAVERIWLAFPMTRSHQ